MENRERCLYLYAVIDTDDWSDAGTGMAGALAGLPGADPDAPPEVVTAGRLGMVVSAVPVDDFAGPEFERHLEDMTWLEPRARAHAEVVGLLFQHQAVLPMRFGTLFSTVESLTEGLGAESERLLAALDAVRGREEWTVRFCANPGALLAEQAAQMQASDDGKAGRGAKYLQRRRFALKGGPAMQEGLAIRAAEADEALAGLALEAAPVRTQVTGVEGGRRSLLSRVYLIERTSRERFLAELERISQQLAASGFAVLVSGPWPPSGEERESEP